MGAIASRTPSAAGHPYGRVVCHDLFTTDSGRQYLTGFYGPGKYDGSTVNW